MIRAQERLVTADTVICPERALETIDEVCGRVPALPARSCYEALQSVWFVQLIAQIESDGTGVSLGNPDYTLYPYYREDVSEGRVTREFAEELMDSLRLKLAQVIEVWPGEDTKFFGGHPISKTVTPGVTIDHTRRNFGVAGCSAFFVDLDKSIQEDIIERTELRFGG